MGLCTTQKEDNSVSSTLVSPASKGRREVPDVEGLVWHKHVILGAPGVRSVIIDSNDMANVEMYKIPKWLKLLTPLPTLIK